MKFRLASPHLAQRFHTPLRFGRRWRGHELALRLAQLAVLVVVAAIGSRLIADFVSWSARAVAGML